MKDPKAIRKAIMTAKSIASLIDPKFARVPLPDIGLPAPDFVVPDHSPSIHEAYDMPMPQKYAAGGDVDDGRASFLEGNHPLVPHVVYHGTDRDISEFEPNQPRRIDVGMGDTTDTGWYSKGHYFTPSPEAASNFASNYKISGEHGPNVMPVHLSLKNPFIVKVPRHSSGATEMDSALNKAGAPQSSDERLIKKGNGERLPSEQTKILRDMGHDGVIVMQQLGHKDEETAKRAEERARMAERIHQEAASEYYDAFGDHENPDRLEAAKDAFIKTRRAAAEAREEAGGEYRPTEFVVFEPHQIKSAIGNRGSFDPSNPNIGYAAGGDVDAGRELNKFGLYSHAAEQAAALPQERGTPEQYRGMLLNRGVKPAELEWSGFDDAFANKPQVTRDELAEHFRTNMPDLYETQYGGSEQGGESYEKMRERHAQEAREQMLERGLADLHGRPYEGESSVDMLNRHNRERASLKDRPYHEYHTVPGGENYREILLQHNAFGGFEGVKGHFGGAPDIIASLRMKDREDIGGNKLLHLEELQSDWAQQGRKNGFGDDVAAKHHAAREEYNNFIDRLSEMETQRRIDALKEEQPDFDFEGNGQSLRMLVDDDVRRHPHSVARNFDMLDEFGRLLDAYNEAWDNDVLRKLPNKAAYVTKTDDWVDLGLKRALLEAAKGDYDKLAWSPGDVHADRYDLSRHISKIRHEKNEDGTYNLDVFDKHGARVFDQDDMHPDAVEETVGKEMAEKIFSGHGDKDEDPGYRDWRTLSGLNLKVGGEGMRKFYDEMLPKRLLKLAKQHDPDARLSETIVEHPDPEKVQEAAEEDDDWGLSREMRDTDNVSTHLPVLHITPKMRESILKKGFAAYADGGEVEGYAIGGVPDIDVDRYRQHLKRIYSPLSEDPEAVKKALQIAGSYHAPVGMETGTGSLYKIKQSMPASSVTRTIQDIPGVNLKPKKQGSWEDFYDLAKGHEFVNVGGDLSGFGRLTHINGKPLAWPVDLHAGADYMREPNPGRVWANIQAHATSYKNKIREANERGKELYGILSPMGASAVNSSHNMFDTLMAQIPNANIDPKHLKEFDEAIKRGDHIKDLKKNKPKLFAEYIENLKKWPGLEKAKEVSDFARPQKGNINGGHRTKIVEFMDQGRWRDRGFPEVGVTRAAITNPDLMGVGGNKLGFRVVKLSNQEPKGGKLLFQHSTYPVNTFGEYVMDVPLVQRHYAQPDVIDRLIMNPTKSGQIVHPYSEDALGRSTARKMFEEQKQIQPVSPRFLDSVMMGMENQEKYGFKKGGAVRRALMIAKSAKKK